MKKIKNHRAAGINNIPADLYKILLDNEEVLQLLLHLMNQCWKQRKIPASWHKASVVTLFKKGDSELCKNYRPISLLQVMYKLFASIILMKMKVAGAEQRIWRTQFGFRSNYGTNDALFMVRRIMDLSFTSDDQFIILALDWAKAFDCICPDMLCDTLHRFGIHHL